jgi:hypothetical protein
MVNQKARFEASYVVDAESGFWLWNRSLDMAGYGRMRYERRLVQAHRVSLMLAGLKLDPKVEVSASCGRRDCVNPDLR